MVWSQGTGWPVPRNIYWQEIKIVATPTLPLKLCEQSHTTTSKIARSFRNDIKMTLKWHWHRCSCCWSSASAAASRDTTAKTVVKPGAAAEAAAAAAPAAAASVSISFSFHFNFWGRCMPSFLQYRITAPTRLLSMTLFCQSTKAPGQRQVKGIQLFQISCYTNAAAHHHQGQRQSKETLGAVERETESMKILGFTKSH